MDLGMGPCEELKPLELLNNPVGRNPVVLVCVVKP